MDKYSISLINYEDILNNIDKSSDPIATLNTCIKNTDKIEISNQFDITNINLVKISKAFWEIEPSTLNLNPFLLLGQSAVAILVVPKERRVLGFNYRLSPVIFTFNEVTIRMPTDSFSMLLYIYQSLERFQVLEAN